MASDSTAGQDGPDRHLEASSTQDVIGKRKRVFHPLRSLKKLFGHGGTRRQVEFLDSVTRGEFHITRSTTEMEKISSIPSTDPEDSISLSSKQMSLSADSVFSRSSKDTLRQVAAISTEAISHKNELGLDDVPRRTDDDDGLPQSPFTLGTTADVLIENRLQGKSNKWPSYDSGHSLISDDSCEDILEDDFFKEKWTSVVKLTESDLASGGREDVSTPSGELDLNLVERHPNLNLSAAIHRMNIKPKGRRALTIYQQKLRSDSPINLTDVRTLPQVQEEICCRYPSNDSIDEAIHRSDKETSVDESLDSREIDLKQKPSSGSKAQEPAVMRNFKPTKAIVPNAEEIREKALRRQTIALGKDFDIEKQAKRSSLIFEEKNDSMELDQIFSKFKRGTSQKKIIVNDLSEPKEGKDQVPTQLFPLKQVRSQLTSNVPSPVLADGSNSKLSDDACSTTQVAENASNKKTNGVKMSFSVKSTQKVSSSQVASEVRTDCEALDEKNGSKKIVTPSVNENSSRSAFPNVSRSSFANKSNPSKISNVKPVQRAENINAKVSDVKFVEERLTGGKKSSGESCDMKKTSDESICMKKPSGELSGVKKPSGESSNVKKPSGESSDVKKPSGESSDVKKPSGESSDVKKPSGESSDVKKQSGESSDVKKPSGEASDVKKPSGEACRPNVLPKTSGIKKSHSISFKTVLSSPVYDPSKTIQNRAFVRSTSQINKLESPVKDGPSSTVDPPSSGAEQSSTSAGHKDAVIVARAVEKVPNMRLSIRGTAPVLSTTPVLSVAENSQARKATVPSASSDKLSPVKTITVSQSRQIKTASDDSKSSKNAILPKTAASASTGSMAILNRTLKPDCPSTATTVTGNAPHDSSNNNGDVASTTDSQESTQVPTSTGATIRPAGGSKAVPKKIVMDDKNKSEEPAWFAMARQKTKEWQS